MVATARHAGSSRRPHASQYSWGPARHPRARQTRSPRLEPGAARRGGGTHSELHWRRRAGREAPDARHARGAEPCARCIARGAPRGRRPRRLGGRGGGARTRHSTRVPAARAHDAQGSRRGDPPATVRPGAEVCAPRLRPEARRRRAASFETAGALVGTSSRGRPRRPRDSRDDSRGSRRAALLPRRAMTRPPTRLPLPRQEGAGRSYRELAVGKARKRTTPRPATRVCSGNRAAISPLGVSPDVARQ
jgi:hypothetical protein